MPVASERSPLTWNVSANCGRSRGPRLTNVGGRLVGVGSVVEELVGVGVAVPRDFVEHAATTAAIAEATNVRRRNGSELLGNSTPYFLVRPACPNGK